MVNPFHEQRHYHAAHNCGHCVYEELLHRAPSFVKDSGVAPMPHKLADFFGIFNDNMMQCWSREVVRMIATQRGFQANSKGVTTVDTMLETVIGMKR